VVKLSGLENRSPAVAEVLNPGAQEKIEPLTALLILFVGSTATTLLAGVKRVTVGAAEYPEPAFTSEMDVILSSEAIAVALAVTAGAVASVTFGAEA
jgi:hypothetical protein